MHALAPVVTLGPSWMDPQWLLDQYGGAFFWISLAIIFIECGLFFPILPGDSLLFAIGMFSVNAKANFDIPLYVSIPALMAAAFAGNVVGYEIGRAIGTPLYERDGRIIKKKYFDQTNAFFDKHGNKALVIGRFVPIVRTFITVVAGVSKMDRKRFFTWSAVGAVFWVGLIVSLGVMLGNVAFVRDNLETAILLIVALSVLPMVIEYIRHKRQADAIVAETAEAAKDIVTDER
ncbi:DedA family protein [Yimella sp. cx-51]|uniref:DedA family protein n=1 Tax=Yimella sp. cx-51 TaxID=2770551 RepID=UPI00165D3CFC|nr:VTT domain-containing protein [Yimella sp. cx-51]MBC9955711.1 VTT domain-containing protein [Yimella sp. cx-51]QTH39678.1 VTT domain-containing protein [Yimella sp. cx-51]